MVQTACTYANKHINNPVASENDYSEAHAGYIIAPSQSQTLTQTRTKYMQMMHS